MAAAQGIYVYKNAIITIEAVVYTNQVTKARLVPDVPVQTMRTLVPDGVIVDTDSAVWTLELSGGQKNDTGGLAKLFRDTAPGTQLDVILQPQAGFSQPTATFVVTAMPVEFGGEQGSFMTFEVELPVIGAPVFGTSAAS